MKGEKHFVVNAELDELVNHLVSTTEEKAKKAGLDLLYFSDFSLLCIVTSLHSYKNFCKRPIIHIVNTKRCVMGRSGL